MLLLPCCPTGPSFFCWLCHPLNVCVCVCVCVCVLVFGCSRSHPQGVCRVLVCLHSVYATYVLYADVCIFV